MVNRIEPESLLIVIVIVNDGVYGAVVMALLL